MIGGIFIDLELWKSVSIIIGVVVSTLSIFMSVIEYSKQGTQKRANYFFELRRRFLEKEIFMEICLLCENNDPKIKTISDNDRLMLLDIFEEVAIAMNSNLIRKEVVHYMFGYYVIKCWKCDSFWEDLDKNSSYWELFHKFVIQMEEMDTKKLKYNHMRF
ncbi:hypothetical protein [Methanosarcina mazei]|jgi:hypothetical protein|uniref:DUF4760 domain-containing protein n=1 Tax=Methanosarcina mazei TaxID=2209 RepID=A0A0F8H1H3_METMZ|nr:hypothetical protein [Methanosarcina mazei]KKG15805.1 hypothetical protein DU34_01435 [Methanosarcina mazei]KKG33337.1 hypothetical protein DU49_19125 [Methanosarcina mazei]KKG41037.1 hypothetical protein DU35_01350 [Methanosarcina mazei]KKG46418.1 hypothetical protein DU39_18435 [Methanosarcina mazei]KKG46548.1 hypothetical protein DU41_19770 [Methanosarcina mazei]